MDQASSTPQAHNPNERDKKLDDSAITTLSASTKDLSIVGDKARNNNANPQQGGPSSRPASVTKGRVEGSSSITLVTQLPPRPPAIKIPPTKRDGRKLFIGGLPSTVTRRYHTKSGQMEHNEVDAFAQLFSFRIQIVVNAPKRGVTFTDGEFLSFFEQFGTVIDSVVMFDRETRRSRGFGFVTFEDQAVAQAVLNLGAESSVECSDGSPRSGRIMIGGKSCEVKAAEPKDASSSNSPQQSGGRNGAMVRNNHSSSRKISSFHAVGKSKVDPGPPSEKIVSDGGNSREHNMSEPHTSQVAENMFSHGPPGSYYEATPFHQGQEALPYGVQGQTYANNGDLRQTFGESVVYNPGNVVPGSYYPVPMAAPMAPATAMYNPYVAYSPQGARVLWPHAHEMYEQDSVLAPSAYVPAPYMPVYYPPDGTAQNYYHSFQPGMPGNYPMMVPSAAVAGNQVHVTMSHGVAPDYQNSSAEGEAKVGTN